MLKLGDEILNRNVYKTYEDFKNQNEYYKTNLPYSSNCDVLKSNITVKNHTINNRLLCQAMEGCDGSQSGTPTELTMRRYERFAKGGAGTIWFEATATLKEGKANPRQLFICKQNLDEFKYALERIKEAGFRENGFEPVVIMQLTHSGRYSKPNGVPEPLIAYNNPILERNSPISQDRILTDDYLDGVRDSLIEGAFLAQKAGFDGADIKCCHRYLNSELLSAYTRSGKYGGEFLNRTRLLRESVQGAIAKCSNDFIVSSRLNIYDGLKYPYGFGVSDDGSVTPNFEEPQQLAELLYSYGVRLLNISMGNPYFSPHINRPFASGEYLAEEHPIEGVKRILEGAKKIKESVPKMAVICSGTTFLGAVAPNVVSAYIQNGDFDMAGFGRMSFAYPDFAKDILKNNKMDKTRLCICCGKCTQIMRCGGTTGCVVRDTEKYLPIYNEYCRRQQK